MCVCGGGGGGGLGQRIGGTHMAEDAEAFSHVYTDF